MKYRRWSLMEWIFAGSLPPGGSRASRPAQQPLPADAEELESRLEQTVGELRKERQEQEQAAAANVQQKRRERMQKTSRELQDELSESEQALASREGALTRELPGEEEPEPVSFAEKLRSGIGKTREKLGGGLGRIVLGRKEVDRGTLEELEELLLTSDLGPQTTTRLIKALESRLRREELKDAQRLKSALQEEVRKVMERSYRPPNLEGRPVVILFAGVNGTGKTTTIGKLGAQFRREGKKVLLVAGDTFRAAASEQLQGWGQRSGCEVFHQPAGSNPSGVVYQAVEKALRENFDFVFCDTAGRLHTKTNLMEELKKIKRVIGKLVPDGPQETYLVLDANNGQNAIFQAREFHEALELTGLIVTKLDGTARGGVLVGIVNEFEIPVRYVGVGEKVDDLRPFEPLVFAESLFE